MIQRDSVWRNEWESDGSEPWEGGARTRRIAGGEKIGATVYELPPGATGGLYHFHHGHEEMIVILKGTVTLRTTEGEYDLREGEIVLFPCGAAGVHQTINRTSSPTRHLIVSNLTSPEVVEYPDTGQISVMARTASSNGEPLVYISKPSGLK